MSTPNLSQLQDNFQAQIQVLLEEQVPVISFYFGLPDEALLTKVKASGAVTMGTATCLDEAQQLQAAGIECIVVQGSEAGGHRGTFYTTDTDYRQCMTGTTTLVALLSQHIKQCHLLAAGGIMTGQQVVAALAAGAAAAQVGTAFLTCHEAATSQTARHMLLQDHQRGTVVTQAFTSRPARGLITQVTKDLQEVQRQLPTSMYGLVNARPLFMAAAEAGLPELQKARISVIPAQHSWVALPGPLVNSLLDTQMPMPLVLRLLVLPPPGLTQRSGSSRRGVGPPRYVAWSGACSSAAGSVELAAGLAAALQLPAGVEVSIELLPTIAAASAVVVEPAGPADWEVVELNAGLLEDMLLSQERTLSAHGHLPKAAISSQGF
eukprot:gene2724-3021_t